MYAVLICGMENQTSSLTISCGSLLIPNTTFGLVRKRPASSPQNSANCSVVAAVGSLVFPMTCVHSLIPSVKSHIVK